MTAAIRVTASIVSMIAVEVDGECVRVETNEPDAVAMLDGREIPPDGAWHCPYDPTPDVMYAYLVRLR